MSGHFVSVTCGGEVCSVCGRPATHKIEEAIAHDEPPPYEPWPFDPRGPFRHPFTAYVCCLHFTALMGSATTCPRPSEVGPAPAESKEGEA